MATHASYSHTPSVPRRSRGHTGPAQARPFWHPKPAAKSVPIGRHLPLPSLPRRFLETPSSPTRFVPQQLSVPLCSCNMCSGRGSKRQRYSPWKSHGSHIAKKKELLQFVWPKPWVDVAGMQFELWTRFVLRMVVKVGLMPAPSQQLNDTSMLEQHQFFLFVGVAMVDLQHAPQFFYASRWALLDWSVFVSKRSKFYNSALVPRRDLPADLPADTRQSTNVSWPFWMPIFLKLCRSIVGAPPEIDWNANRHDIFISSGVEVHNCTFAIDPDFRWYAPWHNGFHKWNAVRFALHWTSWRQIGG